MLDIRSHHRHSRHTMRNTRFLCILIAISLPVLADAQSDPAAALRVPIDRSATLGVAPLMTDAPTATRADSTSTPKSSDYRWCNTPVGSGRRVTQAAVTSVFVGGNLGLYRYFKDAWWSGARAPFHLNYDWNGPFLDQDKAGHFLGGYMLSDTGRELLKSACMSDTKATILAALYAAAFQFQIEVWDGTQAQYGFSPPDMLFNTLGQGFSVARHYVPVLQAITPAISYSQTDAMRNSRARRISSDLRPTVDYSGQTYWFTIDVDTLLRGRAKKLWPSLIRFSIGHTITDWVSPTTGEIMRADRRILLSLDLDPLKLPGHAPWWVGVKKGLRHYHFPAPALEFRSSGVKLLPWHK